MLDDATTPRPDGLGDHVGPMLRCAAFACAQPAEGNFDHGRLLDSPEFCVVHNRELTRFINWLDARSITKGPAGSLKAARMFWDGTLSA